MSNFLNRIQYEVLGSALGIIIMASFCKVSILLLSVELPQNNIPYFIIE
jgi:hypothetical protein